MREANWDYKPDPDRYRRLLAILFKPDEADTEEGEAA